MAHRPNRTRLTDRTDRTHRTPPPHALRSTLCAPRSAACRESAWLEDERAEGGRMIERVEETARDRMIQGRIWMQRVPRRALPRAAAEQRYEWWRRLHPRLFDPRRYRRNQAPPNVGKGC